MTKINVVYATQEFPSEVKKSIFLAGPTPRNNSTQSWRPNAIKELERLGYDGHVFVPEPENGQFSHSYDDQINWEVKGLKRADIILFWIPREMEHMPALTTNVEFGYWINSGKVVFGAPDNAVKIEYLKRLAAKENVPFHNTLENTLQAAIDKIGEGALRVNGECEIPLFIWRTQSFQNWYQAHVKVGNRLDGAEVKWTFRVGADKSIVFMWIIHVSVYVKDEDRNKINEFVVSRTNTSSVFLYKKEDNILDTKIVLVKEFRSTVSNDEGFIYELAGGSSFNPKKDIFEVASGEVEEEVGIHLDPSRFRYIQQRQSSGTVLANQVALFAAEVTDAEIDWLKTQKGIAKGNFEDSEMTYTEIVTLKDILDNTNVDWSNLGMIAKVLLEQ